jgi:glutamate-ammonia-ligase adenylyltransferase
MQAEADYERKLDAARRWRKEWHFRIGVHHLRGLVTADEAARQYADLAGAVLGVLWPAVVAQFAARHGPPPGRGAVVLGMGSLGAEKLNAGSDLDLIVIYDPQDVETSDGRRPLATRSYFARLTQAMITALTAQMSEGRLYEVDMRLRPSGNQGPVATSWAAFVDYQQEQAWTWEHLALTSARVIAGSAALAKDVEAFCRQLLAAPRDKDKVLGEVATMRARIAQAKSPTGPLDTKLGAGRMQEVELVAQAGCLLTGAVYCTTLTGVDACVEIGWLSDADRQALLAAYSLGWQVLQATRLLSDEPLDPDMLGEAGAKFLLRETGHDSVAALVEALQDSAGRAARVIDTALAAYDKDKTDEG